MNTDNGLLFLCVANSARSQMAEGLARKLFGGVQKLEPSRFKNSSSDGVEIRPRMALR
jgi:protein-tyrosine-phosphatase